MAPLQPTATWIDLALAPLQDLLCFKPPFALLQNLYLKLLPFDSDVVSLS